MTSTAGLPTGSCDTHMHVYDGRYPTAPDAVVHAPDAAPDEYLVLAAELGIERVVVVQPSAYGLDNRCQLAAMKHFSNTGLRVRGVMVVDGETPVAEIERLHGLGVRGARFHMLPGGAVGWEHLEPVADRIAPFGWHVQLQLNGHELLERAARLHRLPCGLVIDHVGRFMPPVPVDSSEFDALLGLVEAGSHVKLSAPYESSRTGPPDYLDIAAGVRMLVADHPDRMLWATNWPHPGQDHPPSSTELGRLLDRWIPSHHRGKVLVENPARLYDF